jgi:hypothetical protein
VEEDNGQKFSFNQLRVNLKKTSVDFRRDLTHCQIYFCSVEVLKTFKEYYEYTVHCPLFRLCWITLMGC